MISKSTHESSVAADLVRVGLADQRQRAAKLQSELGDHLRDTSLSEDIGEHGRPAKTNSAGTQSEKGDDVGSTTDTYGIHVSHCLVKHSLPRRYRLRTSINVDLELPEDFRVETVDIKENLNSSGSKVDNTATVVGDVDSRETQVRAELDIVSSFNALGDDGQRGHVAESGKSREGEGGAVASITAGGEALLACSNSVDAGVVNGEEDRLEAGGLDSAQVARQARLVRPDVLLFVIIIRSCVSSQLSFTWAYLMEHDLASD